jgi:hypothetical protein
MEKDRTVSLPFTGQVRRMESSQTMGVEQPFPGKGDFQIRFLLRFNELG